MENPVGKINKRRGIESENFMLNIISHGFLLVISMRFFILMRKKGAIPGL
jgi:hypothetical protein